MLTREECLNALETLCTYADCYPSSSGEFVGKMLQEADDTLQELIEEHFELVDLLKKHDLENLSIKELDTWFDRSLWHVNKVNELTRENNRLSNQLVEVSRDVKSKQEMIDKLNKTLNENIYKIFSNPPLKFEELKEKMWIWDNRTKAYAKIRHLLIIEKINAITKEKRNEPRIKFKWGEVVFEENRFYRYEVKDDDYK